MNEIIYFLEVLMALHADRLSMDRRQDTKVGRRLRELRKAGKLSIAELAERAGVSAGMISQVERGLTNPSIKVLEKLHTALSVPLMALLEDGPSAPAPAPMDAADIIRRAADRPFLRVGTQGMTKELLTPRGDHQLQMMVITLPAGASSEDVLMGEGEKAGWILSGSVILTVGDHSAEIFEGDSFEFPSNQRHAIYNAGDSDARLLWIMYVTAPPHL